MVTKTSNRNLKQRTREFALRVIRLVESLPRDPTAQVLGRQLLRAGTSVGANYRAATRAKSPADFIAKMGTVEEEADECAYWLELICDVGKVPPEMTAPLLLEAGELTAIAVASINTARINGTTKRTAAPSAVPAHAALRVPHSEFK